MPMTLVCIRALLCPLTKANPLRDGDAKLTALVAYERAVLSKRKRTEK